MVKIEMINKREGIVRFKRDVNKEDIIKGICGREEEK